VALVDVPVDAKLAAGKATIMATAINEAKYLRNNFPIIFFLKFVFCLISTLSLIQNTSDGVRRYNRCFSKQKSIIMEF
jgi:hypothetical protein